jgi:regulator of PEP synthase PpsR (kinase-PPPase family)
MGRKKGVPIKAIKDNIISINTDTKKMSQIRASRLSNIRSNDSFTILNREDKNPINTDTILRKILTYQWKF